MLSAGVMDKPMNLYGSKVAKKINKHGYNINELTGLTKAVKNPIAVFKTRQVRATTLFSPVYVLILDIGKGSDANFNIVSSEFGKGHSNIDYKDAGLTDADLNMIGVDFLLQTEEESTIAYELENMMSPVVEQREAEKTERKAERDAAKAAQEEALRYY